jgi:hypothetical protein
MKSFGIIILSVFFVPILIIAGQTQTYSIFGQNSLFSDPKHSDLSNNISGIPCDKIEHLVYHNHTMIILKNQNQNLTVPAGIGIIPNDCIFWLHTHDDSGIIHVESPFKTSFSLGQFLHVWSNFENTTSIKELLSNNTKNYMSILLENGTKINTVDNAKNIVLKNNEIISIDLSNQTLR